MTTDEGQKIRVAVGPENTDFGSWNWVGRSLLEDLPDTFEPIAFADPFDVPEADIVIFIKFRPSGEYLRELRQRSILVFVPIDIFGSVAEINESRHDLQTFDLVLVHSERLIRYVIPYSKVRYVDHPLKFVLPTPKLFSQDGPLIWIGRRCNIEPVVAWANQQTLGRRLHILTNGERDQLQFEQFGFQRHNDVVGNIWTEDRHVALLAMASAAVDIKGDGFRARHKPPAKMIDYLASGLPVIANRSSASYWLGMQRGWTVLGADNWQSELLGVDSEELQQQAMKLRGSLDREHCGLQLADLLEEAVRTRQGAPA